MFSLTMILITATKAKQEQQYLNETNNNNNNNNNDDNPINYHNSIYQRQNIAYSRQRNFSEQDRNKIEIDEVKKEMEDEGFIPSKIACKKRQRGKPRADQSVRNASTPAHILSFQQVSFR